jgi:hypothetical protein
VRASDAGLRVPMQRSSGRITHSSSSERSRPIPRSGWTFPRKRPKRKSPRSPVSLSNLPRFVALCATKCGRLSRQPGRTGASGSDESTSAVAARNGDRSRRSRRFGQVTASRSPPRTVGNFRGARQSERGGGRHATQLRVRRPGGFTALTKAHGDEEAADVADAFCAAVRALVPDYVDQQRIVDRLDLLAHVPRIR